MVVKYLNRIIIGTIYVALTTVACRNENPHDYAIVLERAGKNISEIEKAIDYFENQSDPVKLDVFRHFINEVPSYYYIKYSIVNNEGASVIDQNYTPEDLDSLKSSPGNKLSADTLWDIESVSAQQLIDNIDYAFKAKNAYPWTANVNLESFIKYVCPLRVGNEQLSGWRAYFYERLNPYIRDVPRINTDTLKYLRAYIQTRTSPNDDICWVWPRERLPFISPIYMPSFENLSRTSLFEDFEDMNSLHLYRFRAIGIPSTYEYAYYMGSEDGSIGYPLYYDNKGNMVFDKTLNNYQGKVAKIFRKVAHGDSVELNPYAFLKSVGVEEKNIPMSINLPFSRDVTQERTSVQDIRVPITNKDNNFLYISVLDKGVWKIVYLGLPDTAKAEIVFKKMGTNILYRLSRFENGKSYAVSAPFVLKENGDISYIQEHKGNEQSLIFLKFDRPAGVGHDKKYILQHYDLKSDHWNKIDNAISNRGKLFFSKVPRNGLYRLISEENGKTSRPFTIDEEIQIFW